MVQKYTLDNTAKDWDNFWALLVVTNQYNEQGFLPRRWCQTHHLLTSTPSAPSTRTAAATSTSSLFILTSFLKTDRTPTDSFRTNVIESDDASMVVANTSNYWAQDHA